MADWRRDIERALAGERVKVRLDEPLSRHTTFRIGGPARAWLEIENEPALAAALRYCAERSIRWWVLGWGSNVLVSDQGLEGVVLRLVGEFSGVAVGPTGSGQSEPGGSRDTGYSSSGHIQAGAGAGLDDIALAAEASGLAGFEFLAGIPGTLGGGLGSNAGAFGCTLSDIVDELRVMDPDGSPRVLGRSELGSGYRRPVHDGQGVALECRLAHVEPRMPKGKRNGIGVIPSTAEIRRRRRAKQPSGNSAGSFFRNPPGEIAGRLIERCGLKGLRVGAAEVSRKHANFILNTGGARFSDVYELVQIVKANVETKTGILLEEEVQLLPDMVDSETRR